MADERQRMLVQALAQQQGRGAAIGALTGGRGGRQLQQGGSPLALTLKLDQRQKELDQRLAYNRERDELAYGSNLSKTLRSLQKDQRAAAKDFRKEYDSLAEEAASAAPTWQDVRSIDKMLASDEVPGVGYFEGSEGAVGTATRFARDLFSEGTPAASNKALLTGFINRILTDEAGKAQTLVETRRRLMAAGLTGEVSEQVFRDRWPYIKEGIEIDRRRLASKAQRMGAEDQLKEDFGADIFGGGAAPAGSTIGRFTIEVE